MTNHCDVVPVVEPVELSIDSRREASALEQQLFASNAEVERLKGEIEESNGRWSLARCVSCSSTRIGVDVSDHPSPPREIRVGQTWRYVGKGEDSGGLREVVNIQSLVKTRKAKCGLTGFEYDSSGTELDFRLHHTFVSEPTSSTVATEEDGRR